ncbi:MAG: bifunctional oligoribonuclease/PAP phosphatase NrnA [Bacilli bacterium]|nr:bifunctional oligoribonuclease/PAP phosphatase NrnA [Bacilli bacterium]MBN2877548.1 bifunctional oligoribonuclease/PAP phosphatase NrnA [Bacilli bacterium]
MEHILQKIKEYKRIIIHKHIRPDGDCYGAGFGLKEIIKESFPEKEVYVVGEIADYVSFIGTPDTIPDEYFKGALSIVIDTASASRVADQRFALADYVIKIDHHIPVEDFGNYQYVDTTRAATAQLILEFYLKFQSKLKFNMTAAKALYTGIVTDTGRFKYRSVTSDTFKAVAFLVDYGLDFTEILGKLDIKSEKLMKLQGYVLQNFEKTPNGVAYIKMKPEIIEKFDVSLEEATSLVNELSTLEDCPVWMLFAEYENNFVRGRLRSRKPAIDKLANKYNGGGHKLACGANLGDWDTVEKLLLDADILVKEYKSNLN